MNQQQARQQQQEQIRLYLQSPEHKAAQEIEPQSIAKVVEKKIVERGDA